MADPTPQEFADSIGLKPGLAGGPSPVCVMTDIGKSFAMKAQLSMQREGAQALEPFWHEFGSLYLPALLRTYFLNKFDPQKALTDMDSTLYWTTLFFIVGQPSLLNHLERFNRDRLDETISFMQHQAQRMIDIDTRMSRRDGQPLFDMVGIAFILLVTTIGSSVPTNEFGPRLRGKGGDSIRTMLPRFERLRPRVKQGYLEQYDLGVKMLQSCLMPRDLVYPPDAIEKEAINGLICGAFPSGPLANGSCVKPAKGKPMDTCAKCQVVRYCSREHQKLDWKTHKKICLKPNW